MELTSNLDRIGHPVAYHGVPDFLLYSCFSLVGTALSSCLRITCTTFWAT